MRITVSFLIAVAIVTWFWNWRVSIAGFVLLTVVVLSVGSSRHTKEYLVVCGLIGTMLWRWSVLLYQYLAPQCGQLDQQSWESWRIEGTIIWVRTPWSVLLQVPNSAHGWAETYVVSTKIPLTVWSTVVWTLHGIQCSTPHKISRNSLSTLPFFQEEFDYPHWLWTRGYAWSAYGSLTTTAQTHSMRTTIIESMRWYFHGDTLWLLVGMSIGWRAYLSDDQYDRYKESGLVHLIAVSWSNIAFVAVILGYLLFWLPLTIRRVGILVWIIAYTLLCGSDSSILRAALVGWLAYSTIMGWVRISRMRSILYVLTILCFINPYSLIYDVWLQLSLFAVLGIRIGVLFISTPTNTLHRILRNRIVPTITASLWVIPVLLLTFKTINITAMLSSLLVTPLVAPVSILTLSTLLTWIPWLDAVTVPILTQIVNGVERVADVWVSTSVWIDSTNLTITGIFSALLTLAYWFLYQYGMRRKRMLH